MNWHCIILAASRGTEDPMAKAFGASHKCTIPIVGKPMLQWVLEALNAAAIAKPFCLVIDDQTAVPPSPDLDVLAAQPSAPASAMAALAHLQQFPVLITTADHPLLTPAMISSMIDQSAQSGADVCVGLATAEIIQAAYPDTKRTFFNMGGRRVSGCNLFAVMSAKGERLLLRWQELEKHRKTPWRIVSAFGLKPFIWFALGMLTPERAFAHVSSMLDIVVKPVFLPFAEAAIDVDKPADHALAERILMSRKTRD